MYERFELLLKSRGLTAYKVGKDTGVNRSTLSEWKNGRSVPKADKIQRLADYFNVPISYFYEDVSDIADEMRRAADALVEELSLTEDLQRVLSRDPHLSGHVFSDDQLMQILQYARFLAKEV